MLFHSHVRSILSSSSWLPSRWRGLRSKRPKRQSPGTRGAATRLPGVRVDSSAIGCCEELQGPLARGDEVPRPRNLQDASFVNKSRQPRRSCGAAGGPNQTEAQAIVPEEVLNPAGRGRKIESFVFDNFSHQQFRKDGGAGFSTCTFMVEWPNHRGGCS